jgi:hypothetical protein
LLADDGGSMVNGRGDAGRAEAARFLRPPLAECARSLGPGHPATWDLADVYAAALSYQDPVAAERVYREWIRHVQAAPMRSDRLDRLVQHLGVALGMQGRHLNEDELYREAGVSVPLNHVAASGPTSRQSPSKGPEMVLRESVDEARRDYGESSRQLALAKQGLERFLTRQGRYDEAFVLSTEVTNYYRRLPASSGTTAAAHMMDTARAALRAGKDADAATLFAEAVQLWRTIEGGDAAAWNARCAVMETSLRFCDSKAWAGDAVRGTAFFAADGLVYGYHAKSGGLGDPGLSGLRFNLARWVGPSPSQSKTVVTGDAKALRALPDPKAGLYYLGLQVPRNGAEPLRIGQWVLFADWDVSLFGTEPGMPADPAKWAQRLAQPPDEARKRASLTFDEAAQGNYGPGGRGESFGFVAKAAIDLPAGGYRFAARVNDGLRLRVDGKLLIDHWPVSDPGGEAWPYVYGDVQLAAGRHELRVEYFQDVGGSQLWLVAEPLPSVK